MLTFFSLVVCLLTFGYASFLLFLFGFACLLCCVVLSRCVLYCWLIVFDCSFGVVLFVVVCFSVYLMLLCVLCIVAC